MTAMTRRRVEIIGVADQSEHDGTLALTLTVGTATAVI
jgi:hypothetical protein